MFKPLLSTRGHQRQGEVAFPFWQDLFCKTFQEPRELSLRTTTGLTISEFPEKT